jgi:hypothetical protein
MSVSIRVAAGALALLALAATLPTAEAQPSAGGAPACFRLGQVENSKMSGLRTLYLRAGAHTYRLDFASDCNNLGDEPIVLHPFSNSGEICHPIDLDVGFRSGQRCLPSSLRRLTPAETAAIPAKDRP